MGLMDRIFKRAAATEVVPTSQKAEVVKPAVRHEEIPNTLDLGWYWSENKQELQMAKIALKDRATHMYVIGASGSGKTKFLEFLIEQDIEQGDGFGVIDPHGDLIEDIKGLLACYYKRSGDQSIFQRVVLIDPTDSTFTVTFNPLEKIPGVSPAEQAQELISSFKKIWTDSWGVRMEDLLRNSLIALGEAELTLAELPRFLTSASFRKGVLAKATHPVAREYFQRFDTLTDRARITWIEPVMNKVNAFLADDRVRQMLSFPKSSFNLRHVMDQGKILLVKLDKGKLRDSTDLLGSLFMAKIKMAAFSRSDTPQAKRTPFYLYIDEFQNFASDSFAVMLSEARKYGLSLVMAHQTLAQVPLELQSIILGNTGIQVCFRMNRHDAQVLAKEAFEYSGYEVKTVNFYRGIRYWSLGEEWEKNFEELQNLPQRCCFVKHKLEGGMIRIQTRQIKPAWEVLGMGQEQYDGYLRSLPLGRDYVIERSKIEQDLAQRVRNILSLPETEPEEEASLKTEPGLPGIPKAEQSANQNTAPAEEARKPVEPPLLVAQAPKETSAPVYKELVVYLEHIAQHPFMSILQREQTLGLSKYRGAIIRQSLMEAGWVMPHRVSTGKRSGQLVLLEVTEAGYEFLASMKIKAERPKGRGGFLHRYYAHRLKEFAEATWGGCAARIEDASQGRPADVTVRIPGPAKERIIAFEVFMTGESKEVKGIVQDVGLFDEVIVCATDAGALESLKARAVQALDADMLARVTFSTISRYLLPEVESAGKETTDKPQKKSLRKYQAQNPPRPSKSDNQVLIPPLNLEKSRPELEPERRRFPGRRGKRSRIPLTKQMEDAYAHLHDLDWLRDSGLTKLSEVQERIDPMQTMPEARALRGVLMEAARQVLKDISDVPEKANTHYFLEEYLKGKSVAQIARELGVTRSWCSRAYRKEAFELAGAQFVKLISMENS